MDPAAMGRDLGLCFVGWSQHADGSWWAVDETGLEVPAEEAEAWALEVAAERAELETERRLELEASIVDIDPVTVRDHPAESGQMESI